MRNLLWITIISLLLVGWNGCSNMDQHPFPTENGDAGKDREVDLMDEGSVPVSEPVLTRQMMMINLKGETIGIARLIQEKDGVRLQMKVSNLSPGKHGFHIHENGFEGTKFKDAGSHFNPTHKEHGLKNNHGFHLGDLPNLVVSKDGSAKANEFIEEASLEKGHPFSLLGRSIIIHAGEDDHKTDPAGNSGDRIAGGVIPQ